MKRIPLSNNVKELLRVVAAVLLALLIGFIITLFVSKDPIGAYRSFLIGPVTKLNRFGNWIQESITLMLLGLAISLVFKAEIFSLGAEGQMVIGAVISGCIALYTPLPAPLLIPLALAGGALGGFLLGLLPGYLKAYLNANELVSTLMLNTIVLKLYEYILTDFIKAPDAGYTASPPIPEAGRLAHFFPNLPFLAELHKLWVNQTSISIMIYIAIIASVLVYYLMYRTPFGYELRMLGANIKFARYGGMDTRKTIMLATAISGLVAGLAGAHLSMGVHNKLILNITAGLGFEGIVVALLARNNPALVPFTALAYGYLRQGAIIMERSSDVSLEMVLMIQAIIILLVTAERLYPEVRRRVKAHKESKAAVTPKQEAGS